MKKAHDKAISYAKENNMLISFDPNVRLPLFEDHTYLKNVINEYLEYADIVKISDEEVEFITGYKTIEEALDYLFSKGIQLVIYTAGSDGAMAFTKNQSAKTDGIVVKAKDTTGAGDGFIGSFLYQLAKDEIQDLSALNTEQLKEYLTFSNKFCSLSVTKEGAIASYPAFEEC